ELAEKAPVPTPPFWGARVIDTVPLKALIPFVNERMLYQFQWGYKKQGRDLDAWKAFAAKEIRPIFHDLMLRCEAEGILKPKAIYGYWPCVSEGDAVVVLAPKSGAEVARFAFPRQSGSDGLCIADFFRDADSGETDVIGLQVVTVGQQASDVARAWFAEDKYQDYLYLHGASVEVAEALAEYTHKRVRGELGYAAEDDRDIEKMLNQGYRGSRYSFGYPACPNLEDQTQILSLLGADRIGVTLSDEFQLEPEQSTSAIILHHPRAKYFGV
ncbi:MAG: methionine synthase, partial [Rhodospirillaceae bacterium]|nr:methionine synthase [Rhodospirillaceae bacterium]